MKTPRLKRHVSGRAYTRFKGKCTYFGKFGTEAAQQRFQQWLADMDLVEDKFRHVSLFAARGEVHGSRRRSLSKERRSNRRSQQHTLGDADGVYDVR